MTKTTNFSPFATLIQTVTTATSNNSNKMAIINRIRIILHLDRAEVARNVELNNMLGLAGKHMYHRHTMILRIVGELLEGVY